MQMSWQPSGSSTRPTLSIRMVLQTSTGMTICVYLSLKTQRRQGSSERCHRRRSPSEEAHKKLRSGLQRTHPDRREARSARFSESVPSAHQATNLSVPSVTTSRLLGPSGTPGDTLDAFAQLITSSASFDTRLLASSNSIFPGLTRADVGLTETIERIVVSHQH